jgi:hypothetical protein
MSRLSKNVFIRSRDFIVRIRNHEDPVVRKRWLVVFTVPTFALVILFWVFAAGASVRGEAGAEVRASAGPGFFETFGAGLRVVGGRVSRGSERVQNFFRSRLAGPTISVDVSERNFIAEGLEVIPLTPLP